jgi:hypothetical protein
MTSDVSICNLALQKLGAARISSLDQDHKNARAMNNCFESKRDALLRKHAWNFAVTTETLAPDAAAPSDDDYTYQFTLPADCLRVLPPKRTTLDWQVRGGKILTNDTNALKVRYIRRVTNAPDFDALFVDLLACDLADQCCEEITQSNTKKAAIKEDRKEALLAAKLANAFEQSPAETPEDTWLAARR